MKKLFRNILLITLMMFVVVGCSEKKNDVAEQPVQNKDELVLGFGSEPEQGWDPIHGSGHYGTAIFQTALFKRDIDLNIVPDLAKEYKLSDDKKVYEITLRDDVKWSDGEAFTADDVVFTYNLAKEESTPGVNLTRLVEAKKVDDYTVQIVLNEPDISFMSSMCSLSMVPQHAYSEDYGKNPIGTGPFKLVEWKVGQQLIVEPNEYYYGDKVPFKKITFLFFKDDDSVLATAKAGECDIVRIPYTAKDIKVDGFHVESIKTIDNRGISLPVVKNEGKVTDDTTMAPGSPIGNDVTANIEIRKALNIAMDREELINSVLNGEGTKANSVADEMPWYNAETKDLADGDIEGANKLLDDAGWVVGADGIREKDGLKAKFDLLYSYKDRENIALYFADKAKQIGIEVNLVYGDWDFVTPKMFSNAVLFGWGGYDPLEMYYNYSSKFKGFEYYNANYYGNEKVDEYFEKGLSSDSIEGLYENFKLAQWDGETGLSWKGDCPWIWLVNENHLYLVRDNLEIGRQKIQPHGGGWPMLDTIANWTWK
ncbi:peptide/nickel transport system substrate-binding protein [Peptoniphilus asaccharolyticus DSM 20463]|uniref:Peptide/nickel transport system substrate-binding protein n=1 Tax=Peptoniphilus asaccharolyticus DSM 20463 TaxID=573058 RepID=A0A1W1V5G2_PEPAS|nr:ABC transporter substrate-binding protein [Peptoniphilus asaccharolyticus]MBL7576368.1 ABC transporter substrate-binding protein [Peptoniphilus asaccharolyticus]SMB88602.1 peptide/nickel transport system substrate-binding protein [Peptoniphilus asaccharolyticus DSM 20463]